MTELAQDPYALNLDTIKFGSSNIHLLSCDHMPNKTPTQNPWPEIASQIQNSSLVFVEYFPPELETTAYNSRFIGRLAQEVGDYSGINSFFNEVASLAVRYKKDVAITDIANKPLYELYNFSLRMWFGPCILGSSLILSSHYALYLSSFLALAACYTFTGTYLNESNYPSKYESLFIDLNNARRLITAKALIQSAQESPDSETLYIAPHAHNRRIKQYIENHEGLSVRLKTKAYSLLPGLDKKTRVYRHSTDDNAWKKISSTN